MTVVHDLIEEEGLVCQASQNLISHLVGEILGYREEGIELYPTILFCQNVSVLLKSFPGAVMYEVGSAPLSANSVKRVLKDCAPLSARSWHVFIERIDFDTIKYGVFSYISRPTALPLHEAVSAISGSVAIVIRQSGRSTVELHGSSGTSTSVIFSTVREGKSTDDSLTRFAADCCSGLGSETEFEEFSNYFRRLLDSRLTASHGTMLVCAKNSAILSVNAIIDRVNIDPPIDTFSAFQRYRRLEKADAILELQSSEELLQGFINSDGIVMIDSRARVIAYRTFFKGSDEVAEVVGGARRRAFEGVKALVLQHSSSALFRSQDGLMIYAGVSE
jgi:hypothetical protein